MKKLLLAAIIAVLAVANANARIYRTERYWAESDPFNMMPNTSRQRLVSGCAELGYLNAIPAGKSCTTIQQGSLTCYKDCKCPTSHNKTCSGVGEKGVGSKCDGLYASCTCAGNFKYCSGTEDGSGEVCTADGGYKYSECTCSNVYKEKCDGVGVVGVDAACGGLYKSCKCDSAYKYCPSGTEGDGNACTYDGGQKFKYCNTVAVAEPEENDNGSGTAVCTWSNDGSSESVNDFGMMKGLLFDGWFYTDEIAQQDRASNAAASNAVKYAIAYSPYENKELLAEDDERFGVGKWYLPSQGEMLQMYGMNWDHLAEALQKTEPDIVQGVAQGDYAWVGNFSTGTNYKKLQATLNQFKELGMEEFDDLDGSKYKYWTSSVKGKDDVFVVKMADGMEPNELLNLVGRKGSGYSVRPVTEISRHGLDEQFKKAKIGQVVTKNLQILNPEQAMEVKDEDPIMGMIYWVQSNGNRVKIVAMHNARYGGDVSWEGEEGFEWGEDYAYENMPTNAWTCGGVSGEEPEEPEECNDYEKYTGPLFDGKANTDAILNAWGCDVGDPNASPAKAACIVHSFYPEQRGIAKDDPEWGQGQWYLPSVGELMNLYGADWNKVVGNMAEIEQHWKDGEDFDNYYDALIGINYEGFDQVNETYQQMYGLEFASKYWTSNEVNEEIQTTFKTDRGDASIQFRNKEEPHNVLPIIKLTADKLESETGDGPRPGYVVHKDLRFGDFDGNLDDEVGIIFFVSADGQNVWIMHRPLGLMGGDNGDFDPENPYGDYENNLSGSAFSPVGDVPEVRNNPWTCSGDLTVCTEGNDYSKFTGPLFDGQKNTEKLANVGGSSKASIIAQIFYPHGEGIATQVEEDDELFGRGKWYLPSIGELMMLKNMDWNMFAQAVNNLSEEQRNDVQTLLDLSETYGNNEIIENNIIPAINDSDMEGALGDGVYLFKGDYNIISSSEGGNDKDVYIMLTNEAADAHVGYDVKSVMNFYVFPALQLQTSDLEDMGYEPEVGHFVGASRKYYDSGNVDLDDVIGIIYWVSEDKKTLRVISPRAISSSEENPYTAHLESYPLFTDEGVSDVIAKSVDYIYGEKACTVIEGGENTQPGCQASSVSSEGYANTQAIKKQLGERSIAAMACDKFYVPGLYSGDANFGQTKWHLPSIGEWMDVYGYNAAAVTEAEGDSGATGDNYSIIMNTLSVLIGKECDAEKFLFSDGRGSGGLKYWSSSEAAPDNAWVFDPDGGERQMQPKYYNTYGGYGVRPFAFLAKRFTPKCLSTNVVSPKVGDVMYADLSYGSAEDYDGSKTAVGVVTWVSDDGASAKIVSLKNLTFSDSKTIDGFDPAAPYDGEFNDAWWANEKAAGEDVEGVKNCGEVSCFDLTIPASGSGSGSSPAVPVVCVPPKTNVGGSCQCPASYSQTCWPHRPVGSACNGRYESCKATCETYFTQNTSNCAHPVGLDCDGNKPYCAKQTCSTMFAGSTDGRAYTLAAINQIGNKALAAWAAYNFYPPEISEDNVMYGKGKWYLSSVGEFYPFITNYTNPVGTAGNDVVPGTKGVVNEVLEQVQANCGVPTDQMPSYGLLSSEDTTGKGYAVGGGTISDFSNKKWSSYGLATAVRPITKVNADGVSIGDIAFEDGSFGPIDECEPSRNPVGIVYWKGTKGNKVLVVSLRNLHFSSFDQVGNFKPEEPYQEGDQWTSWATSDHENTDITAIPNVNIAKFHGGNMLNGVNHGCYGDDPLD